MPKRSGRRDLNRLAAGIVEDATEEDASSPRGSDKNPAAVELGRLGGLKGGRARAKKLTAKERSELARKAARERWRKK